MRLVVTSCSVFRLLVNRAGRLVVGKQVCMASADMMLFLMTLLPFYKN